VAGARFDRLGRRYGDVVALADFTLDVGDGELVAVVGPSGCGKSTLLRLTAGLETASAGTIHLDGRRIDGLPPHARDVAMVFQSYALYPHLTVRENVEFPLRMRRIPHADRRRQAEEVAGLLELGELLERRPAALSGGQRQRVALARALVRRPALFLLDEPLSNLDVRLRTSVRHYLRDLQRRVGVTTLYVTHDQSEAMTLGARVVVLDRGRIQQVAAPLDVYDRPANAFVAAFFGTPAMNLLEASTAGGRLAVGDQHVVLPDALAGHVGPRRVLAGIRPEAFVRVDGPGVPADTLVAEPEPETAEPLGSEMLVRARLGPHTVVVRLLDDVRRVPPRVAAPAGAIHLFAVEDGARLGP
jgi:ABC-type sugar transport system ATPase subunit